MSNTVCRQIDEPANAAGQAEPVVNHPSRRPYYELENGPESHVLRVDLPGVAKSAVQLRIEDGVLSIRAERTIGIPDSWKLLHREVSDAPYELNLRLNDRVDDSKLAASLADGVLTVHLPVREAMKPRNIAIH